ncbi:hypothetical protein LAJ19_06535 [Deinococcus taeanensis]|uniref:hypothetical protein n=1 Tax=Deinococcus taeanensis TaxID=2737050 RepID=UPI001CDD22E1|nr:hypothetical protein [Deinococcus taeanensis]UBV43867.1 hypothetical protein LAJ19_06535 [Deinococcus taeanensis]
MITGLLLLIAVALIVAALRARPAAPAQPPPVAPAQTPESTVLRLPEPARARAWALMCQVHDALQQPGLDPRSSWLLTQTRDAYLPDTVEAYLSLTPASRALLERQGQPAEALLGEQLTLMEGGLREVLRHDHAAADRLLTQGRFLRERFGADELRLGHPKRD